MKTNLLQHRLRSTLIMLVWSSVSSLLWLGCDSPTAEGETNSTANLDVEVGPVGMNGYSFQQGDLQYTGNPMDLAIVGNGLLVLKSEDQYVYFRRPARFVLNAEGYFTFANEKFHLQGIPLWDPKQPGGSASLPKTDWKPIGDAALVDIYLPFRQMMPARATSEIQVTANLSPSSMAHGSVLHSQRFLHAARLNGLLSALSDSKGTELGMREGDVLTFSKNQLGSTVETSLQVTEATTMLAVVQVLAEFLKPEGGKVDIVTLEQDPTLAGALTIFGNSEAIENLQVTSSRPISSPKVTKAFAVPSTILAGSQHLEFTTDRFRVPANFDDVLSELFDANGNHLGLENGDEITVQGTSGGTPANNVTPITFSDGKSITMVQDLLDKIKSNFQLPERDGTPYNHLSVTMNAPGTDDNIPDGCIVLRGMPGSMHALGSVVITATNSRNQSPSPNHFNANMNMTTLRSAKDAAEPMIATTVFDSLGNAHEWQVKFTPTERYGEWLWGISVADGNEVQWSGHLGGVTFGSDGYLTDWMTYDGSPLVRFVSKGVGVPLSVQLRFGPTDKPLTNPMVNQPGNEPEKQWGLTHFEIPNTPGTFVQNGYAAGFRTETRIDEYGRIQGTFSNGQVRDLYQIPLADFPNEQGLSRVGTNSFVESKASGSPFVATQLGRDVGSFTSGYLEQAPITTANNH